MKRSQMIEHIEQVIDVFYGERNNHDLLANLLLKEIERAGMLPPKSLDIVTLKKGLVRGYTVMFEWDDENESND